MEITRGSTDRFNYNYAGGHTAVLSPSMVLDLKGSWLRFNDDLFPLYNLDLASLGYLVFNVGAVRRLRAASALQHRIGHSDDRRPRRHARRAAERLQQRPHAAVLQRAVRRDAHKDDGRAHDEVRVRLAQPPAEGNQPRLAGRRVRVRQLVHARRPARPPGNTARASPRSCSACRPTSSFIELRPEYDMQVISHGFFAHDDWRVSDRLTAQPRPALRPRARHDRSRESQRRAVRSRRRRIPSRRRRRRGSRPTRRPAFR